MAELFASDTWLATVLTADAELNALVSGRIYGHVIASSAVYPLAMFSLQTARDIQGLGPARIMVDSLYIVRGIVEASTFGGTLKSIADRIDAILQAASGSNVNGSVLACVREQPFLYVEPYQGRQYRHLGGIYRIWSQ